MIKTRLIEEKDLKELAEIFKKVYDTFDVGEDWSLEQAYKLLKYWFDIQPDLAYLAEVDNKIVGGFVIGVKPWTDGNRLLDGEVFVHPDYQAQGVGSELLKSVFKVAIEKYNVTIWDAVTFRGQDFPLRVILEKL